MWPNPQETADLATFTEEILNGKLFFFLQSQFINKFLKFEYFNHHAKVEMWLTLYKFPIFFPQLNLNSDLTFPNWSIDLKLEVLNLGLRLY